MIERDQSALAHFAAYRQLLQETLERLDLGAVARFVAALSATREAGRMVLLFGNGGSGATASHFAGDLNKGTAMAPGRRFRAICLNDNAPAFSAWANDASYDDVFVEPLRNFMRPGDLAVGISGSGNSENVLRAIEAANAANATTAGLCGYSGGRLARAASIVVHVPVEDMQVVEDVHLVIAHMATRALGGGCSAR